MIGFVEKKPYRAGAHSPTSKMANVKTFVFTKVKNKVLAEEISVNNLVDVITPSMNVSQPLPPATHDSVPPTMNKEATVVKIKTPALSSIDLCS